MLAKDGIIARKNKTRTTQHRARRQVTKTHTGKTHDCKRERTFHSALHYMLDDSQGSFFRAKLFRPRTLFFCERNCRKIYANVRERCHEEPYTIASLVALLPKRIRSLSTRAAHWGPGLLRRSTGGVHRWMLTTWIIYLRRRQPVVLSQTIEHIDKWILWQLHTFTNETSGNEHIRKRARPQMNTWLIYIQWISVQ